VADKYGRRGFLWWRFRDNKKRAGPKIEIAAKVWRYLI